MNSREILKFLAISSAVFGSSLFKKGIKMKIRTTISSRIASSPQQKISPQFSQLILVTPSLTSL